jgi:hypothetical protein
LAARDAIVGGGLGGLTVSSISVLSANCRYFRVDLKYRKSGGG